MKSFVKVHEVKRQAKDIWYVQWVFEEDGIEQSEFIKIKSELRPTPAIISSEITKQIGFLNNPPQLPQLIPDQAPLLPGLTAGQQVTLNAIWSALKVWIRQLFGR